MNGASAFGAGWGKTISSPQNVDGLLRQFFPKGMRFTRLSRTKIKPMQAIFNDRPRKVLGWHNPAHAFH